jgi:hypothetical protein
VHCIPHCQNSLWSQYMTKIMTTSITCAACVVTHTQKGPSSVVVQQRDWVSRIAVCFRNTQPEYCKRLAPKPLPRRNQLLLLHRIRALPDRHTRWDGQPASAAKVLSWVRHTMTCSALCSPFAKPPTTNPHKILQHLERMLPAALHALCPASILVWPTRPQT